VLTCTHTDAAEPIAIEVRLEGGTARAARGQVLAGRPQDHNTFAEPERVRPRELAVQVRSGRLAFELPPCAVAAVTVELG